jgi:hypothetical protein
MMSSYDEAIGALVTVAGLVFAFVVLFYVGAKLGFRLRQVARASWTTPLATPALWRARPTERRQTP